MTRFLASHSVSNDSGRRLRTRAAKRVVALLEHRLSPQVISKGGLELSQARATMGVLLVNVLVTPLHALHAYLYVDAREMVALPFSFWLVSLSLFAYAPHAKSMRPIASILLAGGWLLASTVFIMVGWRIVTPLLAMALVSSFALVCLGRRAGIVSAFLSLLTVAISPLLNAFGVFQFVHISDAQTRASAFVCFPLICIAIFVLQLAQEQAKQDAIERSASALKELQKRERETAAFWAMVSHELRTPLQAILGISELLLENKLESHHEKLMRTMDASGKSLLGVIDNLLDVTRLEVKSPKLKEDSVDLRQLVTEVAELLTVRAREQGTSIDVAIEDPQSWVYLGDENRIRQVLVNVVGNAVKYTAAGNVKIRLRRLISKGRKSWAGVQIEVQDTGIGIAATDLERIFDRFEQIRNDHVKKFEGSGLGLAISKSLVDWMNGSMTVASTVGQGSRFTVDLPLRQSPLVKTSSKQPEDQRALQGHVLVVDDNEVNTLVISMLLKRFGLKTSVAKNGLEALSLLDSLGPDAGPISMVLMDCEMPILDGFDTTQAIRKRDHLKQLPIVALSASAYDHVEQKCIEAGMNGYLTKPIVEETLRRELAKWLVSRTDSAIEVRETRAPQRGPTCTVDSQVLHSA